MKHYKFGLRSRLIIVIAPLALAIVLLFQNCGNVSLTPLRTNITSLSCKDANKELAIWGSQNSSDPNGLYTFRVYELVNENWEIFRPEETTTSWRWFKGTENAAMSDLINIGGHIAYKTSIETAQCNSVEVKADVNICGQTIELRDVFFEDGPCAIANPIPNCPQELPPFGNCTEGSWSDFDDNGGCGEREVTCTRDLSEYQNCTAPTTNVQIENKSCLQPTNPVETSTYCNDPRVLSTLGMEGAGGASLEYANPIIVDPEFHPSFYSIKLPISNNDNYFGEFKGTATPGVSEADYFYYSISPCPGDFRRVPSYEGDPYYKGGDRFSPQRGQCRNLLASEQDAGAFGKNTTCPIAKGVQYYLNVKILRSPFAQQNQEETVSEYCLSTGEFYDPLGCFKICNPGQNCRSSFDTDISQ